MSGLTYALTFFLEVILVFGSQYQLTHSLQGASSDGQSNPNPTSHLALVQLQVLRHRSQSTIKGPQDDFEKLYVSEGFAEQIYNESVEVHHLYDHKFAFRSQGNSSLQHLESRILLHHIWKTGGTHICDLALDAGLPAPRNPGCHAWKDMSAPLDFVSDVDVCKACAFMSEDDAHALEATPFTVIGHECPVSDEILKLGHHHAFHWVSIMRCPFEQAASWYRHILGVGPETIEERTIMWPTAMAWAQQKEELSGFVSFVDNIQTRWFAGEECIYIDKLTDACLTMAKTNLRTIDTVLEQSGRDLLKIERLYALGWPKPDGTDADAGGKHPDETSLYVDDMTPKERAFFEDTQQFDIELLSWARAEGII